MSTFDGFLVVAMCLNAKQLTEWTIGVDYVMVPMKFIKFKWSLLSRCGKQLKCDTYEHSSRFKCVIALEIGAFLL